MTHGLDSEKVANIKLQTDTSIEIKKVHVHSCRVSLIPIRHFFGYILSGNTLIVAISMIIVQKSHLKEFPICVVRNGP